MYADIVDLRDFYQSPLGQRTQNLLCRRVNEMWPAMRGERIATLGYGLPVLRALSQKAAATYALMPAMQGAAYWPADGANVACLVEMENLPLADNSLDRILMLHALEGANEPDQLLREAWRVLKSGGRLLVIVPNRRGLWAHSDRTPFGNGQPFSARQIKKALHNQGFLVENHASALFAPPGASQLNQSWADRIESLALQLFPGWGGLLLFEASKQLYAPFASHTRLRHRLVLPMTMPTPQPT